MAPVTQAPKLSKRRKLGKGKKKAWRAANVQDIEEFLDDERRQRETTGGLISEKSSANLFFVDKSKVNESRSPSKPISKQDRRNRALRSTALLEPCQHIPSAFVPVKEDYKKGRKNKKLLDSLQERATSKVRVEAVQQLENYVKEKRIHKKQKHVLPNVTEDVWNDDVMDTSKVKRPKKLLAKPSKLMATVIPHPGASINPTFEDHQALLQTAVESEEIKRKKALRTVNALKLINKSDLGSQETYLAEMSAGLIDESESEVEEQEENNEEVGTSVRVPQRKSKRQRKAEVKLGEQMRNKKAEADRRRRENMVFRLRGLKTDIRKQDVKEKERLEVKQKLKEQAPYMTKRLGKIKYEDPDADLKLSTELKAFMREVKPEGNILDDVYSSMLKRNVLEPRVKQTKKKTYKLKLYTKKSHKEIT